MRKHKSIKLLILIFLAIFCIPFVQEGFPRAGGGQNYSGGGSSSPGTSRDFSGGHDGYSGDGTAITSHELAKMVRGFIKWLYPNNRLSKFRVSIVVVFCLVLIGFMTYLARQSKIAAINHQLKTIKKSRSRRDDIIRNQAQDRMLSLDPQFSAEQFLQRSKDAFFRIQKAWSQQDMDTVRHFISEGVYERFSLQLREQRDSRYRNCVDNIHIHHTEIANMYFENQFDVITVLIHAQADDYDLDLQTDKRIKGTTTKEAFIEFWTYVRSSSVKTRQNVKGLVEGHCPNCGAMIILNASAQCQFCKSLVSNGQYDWVLAEITQSCDWKANSQSHFQCDKSIKESDPGFSAQNLEDRASVMFWRWVECYRLGKLGPIYKMATDPFSRSLEKKLKPTNNLDRIVYQKCAVGAVDTLEIVQGENYESALVQIRWTGGTLKIDYQGQIREDYKVISLGISCDIYVLIRKKGVVTNINQAFTSTNCPSCGGARSHLEEDCCEYCGSVLNDGYADWVLAFISSSPHDKKITDLREKNAQVEDLFLVSPDQSEPSPTSSVSQGWNGKGNGEVCSTDEGGRQIRSPTPPNINSPTSKSMNTSLINKSSLELTGWMINVMMADGSVDEEERKLIQKFASARGIKQHLIDQLIAAMEIGKLKTPFPDSSDEVKEWLGIMAEMTLSDGAIDDAEKKAMMCLGRKLNLAMFDINQIIARKRRELYKNSKHELRRIKKLV